MTVALADLLIRLLTPWQPPVRDVLPSSTSLALDVDAQPSAAAEFDLVRPLPIAANEMRRLLDEAGILREIAASIRSVKTPVIY